ncbi:MAG: hypothetical protein NVSMB17_00070 [Candidatus Dormibacteria bacterium]
MRRRPEHERPARAAIALLSVALVACGSPPADVRSGKVRLRILQPTQEQRLSARSLSVAVSVEGIDSYRLRYYLDGADQGQGDTAFTIFDLGPGRHTVDVDLLRDDGRPLTPDVRASVGFTSD